MRRLIRNLFLNLAGSVSRPKSGVHIINSHYVHNGILHVEKDKEAFRSFVKLLTKNCELIRIEIAVEMISSGEIVDKPYVAFTFDDGFEECYSVIAPVLEEYDCNAAFFINSNYVEADDVYQKEFHERIKVYNKKPMNWSQIATLLKRGHVIGSHTCDHLDMAQLTDAELEFQLQTNKETLESILDYKCDFFAWPYGQNSHFSELALKKTLKYHKYIFSSSDYKKYFSYLGKVINRRHIEPFWSKFHINFFLAVRKIK